MVGGQVSGWHIIIIITLIVGTTATTFPVTLRSEDDELSGKRRFFKGEILDITGDY